MDKKEEKILKKIQELGVVEPAWGPHDILYFGPLTRAVTLFGPVDKSTVVPAMSQILELNARETKIIKLYINTDGGNLTDAFALYDIIRTIESPVITIASGMCASAGLILLSAGDYRLSTKNCLFFYHQPILNTEIFISKEASNATNEAYNMCDRLYNKTIIDRASMSREVWKENFQDRTVKYFNAYEALKFNIIDEIITAPNKEYKIKLVGK